MIPITGYILDIDGTLLSSQEVHLRAWHRILKEYAFSKTDGEISRHFGKPSLEIINQLIGTGNPTLNQTIIEKKTGYFMEEIDHIPLYPGVKEILKQIHASNIPICFASANLRSIMERMMHNYKWAEISVGYICVEDVKKSKPDPEMILKSLGLLKRPAHRCVTIGDSFYDIAAGRAAGTKTIAVCTKNSPEEFRPYSPDLIIKEFGELAQKLPLTFLD